MHTQQHFGLIVHIEETGHGASCAVFFSISLLLTNINKVNLSMTLIESIYEIKAALIELRERLPSKSAWVSKHVQIKYEKLVERFFRENANFVIPG